MDKEYKVVGIRFKKAGKVYFFEPGKLALQISDTVIVETIRGLEIGRVVIAPRIVDAEKVVLPLKCVVRIATEDDLKKNERNREEEKKSFKIGKEKIEKHKLEMKLLEVEYIFDRSKVIFYFTAEGRIDFRELVKDLASVLRTRIELRQIGVRDEAKKLGGYGCCGREICCASFLGDFDVVSIKMAKNQDLSLNPVKITGVCGRLMCCLSYENDSYSKLKGEFPKIDSEVIYEGEKCRVYKNHLFKNKVTIRDKDGGYIKADLKDIEFIKKKNCSNKCCKKGAEEIAKTPEENIKDETID